MSSGAEGTDAISRALETSRHSFLSEDHAAVSALLCLELGPLVGREDGADAEKHLGVGLFKFGASMTSCFSTVALRSMSWRRLCWKMSSMRFCWSGVMVSFWMRSGFFHQIPGGPMRNSERGPPSATIWRSKTMFRPRDWPSPLPCPCPGPMRSEEGAGGTGARGGSGCWASASVPIRRGNKAEAKIGLEFMSVLPLG